MTTPRVIELPRRLEATSPDTFLGLRGGRDDRPLAEVVALRPRDRRRVRAVRGGAAGLSLVGGPGDDAA